MRLTFDRILGVLALILTFAAPIDFFRFKRVGEGILISILVLLIGALLLHRWIEENRTLFTYLTITKKLTFLDAPRDIATLVADFKVRANHTGLQQLWFRNINCDGEIKNICVDSKPTTPQRKAGSFEVCKQFSRPLKRGDEENVQLSYELHKSFSGSTEGITHVVASSTKLLSLTVVFHKEHSPKDFRAFVGQGSGMEEALKGQPRSIDGGTGVEFQVIKPKMGSFYTVEWKW